MKRSDSILQNYYMSKLPKYQERPGTVLPGYAQQYLTGRTGDLRGLAIDSRFSQNIAAAKERDRQALIRATQPKPSFIQPAAARTPEHEAYRRRKLAEIEAINPNYDLDAQGELVKSGYARFMDKYGRNLDKFAGSLETPLAIEGALSMKPLFAKALGFTRKITSPRVLISEFPVQRTGSGRSIQTIKKMPTWRESVEAVSGKNNPDFNADLYANSAQGLGVKYARLTSELEPKLIDPDAFKSEINWGAWNPDTPKYPELINEYNAIEEATKKAGTWMKNSDGSPFRGTPEQFIQQQSSYFKKAFPKGFEKTYRGGNNDPLLNREHPIVFTGDYNTALQYTGIPSQAQVATPQNKAGRALFDLYLPKNDNAIVINNQGRSWREIPRRYFGDNPPEHDSYRFPDISEGYTSTDDIAKWMVKNDKEYVKINKIFDSVDADHVTIVNQKPGNYLKSAVGNVGFFDMTNPNIYKGFVPAAILTGTTAFQSEKKQGGPIINQRGFMDGVPPQGSNWRIMGDGQGTSITMDLPNMPDEILVVPDGDFDQAKVMKQGEEEYFMGADFVDEYLLKDGGLTPNKAREILHDKEVHGKPLTEKQRRYFGAMSKGHTKKYQIGGKTDEEKRALAKRTIQIARRRADKGEWVDVPESIREAADKLGEPSFSCIGGVCDVLKEADVIPRVIWSNTEFARLAPSLGFNAANRGWGLKGIENLEPGDIVQWMDPDLKNLNKAIPHHGQIYLGTNIFGELEFFDNFNKVIKTYPKERIEEQLSWNRKPAESQMQIYKINPYNPKPGNVNPEAQKALEEREANVRYQTDYNGNLPKYEYSLRPDSPYYNNPPIGMVKFMDKANDSEFINDVIKSVDKAGYGKRATREQVHDSLLNVFGILGQENKWNNPWVGGDVTGGRSPIPIPLESTVERIASPSSMSIGPGQIKYSQIKKPIRKAFGINRRQDLQNWDKVIPLMVGMDIANKQWMENQGERFSERIIGQPGLRSDQFKWEEGRMSPYFYRGPGVKNVRKYVESLYGKDWYDKFKPQYMQDVEEMEEDPAKREQFVKDNIRQYQLVFDPGSYGQRVFENINKNLQRKILRWGETDAESTPENATTLREVILTSKRPPSRQLGGNALAMLRDYGGGMSVSPLYKSGGQHGGLDRWFAEKWVDVKTGKPCGRQEGESRAYPACRPSKRVSSKTPKTSSELSSAEKEKFKRSKTSSERIPYSHKRRK